MKPKALMKFPRAQGAWYEVKPKAQALGGTVTEIWIYDVIGEDWWDDSLSAKVLCQQIAAITTDEIVLHVSSPGGSVTDGIAIANALRAHAAHTTAIIEAQTASIATVIAFSCDTVQVWDNATALIHQPWTMACGNSADFRDLADWLDKVGAGMVTTYMLRCTKTVEELQAALVAETLLDPQELIDWGFADEIVTGLEAAALAHQGSVPFASAIAAFGFSKPDVLADGRVLSAGNEQTLKDALDLIDQAEVKVQSVIASVDPTYEPDDPEGPEEGAAEGSADTSRTVGSEVAALL
jgi:ATP-dependent protease ClpP protease subunit